MEDHLKAAVTASFAADALALGAHWMYDIAVIKDRFKKVERFVSPPDGSFHRNRVKGDLTHYGEQTLWLLDSLALQKRFEPQAFSERWRQGFENYDGYVDQATRATLANLEQGKSFADAGSGSDDLSGAARIAPLLAAYRQSPESDLIAAARTQTAMTHNQPEVVESAELFARLARRVLDGQSPQKVLAAWVQEDVVKTPLSQWLQAGLESTDRPTAAAISNFGQSCHVDAAFPGVIHLIAKYENNLEEALIENVMAGGDSAARGLMAGMILGAHLGTAAIPAHWQSELRCRQRLEALLAQL